MRWLPMSAAILAMCLAGCAFDHAPSHHRAHRPVTSLLQPHTHRHHPRHSSRPAPPAPVTRTPVPPRTSPVPAQSSPDAPSSVTSPPALPADGSVQQVFDAMNEEQRVGQLLMVDCPSTGVAAATLTAIRTYHVGSVILDGNSTLSIRQTRGITDQLQSTAPAHTKLFVATDQEGGLVRRMRGPGFSDIPSALEQGGFGTSTLQADATDWGRQLRHAGVNVDLAPVLDTVPPDSPGNPPIGDLDREYGHDPATVARQGTAFARGLAAAGVDATAKHFPGLGRVSGNTDTTPRVNDSVTTRHDAYLDPFRAAVRQHVPFVMMSTAIYSRIDPGTPAAFSPAIVTGILRHDLGFTGVIVSDDLGAAQQVSGYSVADRAVRFVGAGGDLVLTVDATQAHEMTSALLAEARASRTFRHKVNVAALHVLQAKAARGLLG